MGWTVFNKPPQGGMVEAVLQSMSDFGKREIVASATVRGVVYAAVRDSDGVGAAIGVIDGLGYKLMAEEEGPYYYDAPAEVLDALSPTTAEFAVKWRGRCRALLAGTPSINDKDVIEVSRKDGAYLARVVKGDVQMIGAGETIEAAIMDGRALLAGGAS